MKNQRKFKENSLFRAVLDDSNNNACVGDNGGPYDLYDYAHGYLAATHTLLIRAKSAEAVIDTLVYPICFIFRHSIELIFKYMITDMRFIARESDVFKLDHRIDVNWSTVKNIAGEIGFDLGADELLLIDIVVKSFAEVDPIGQIFRYPESIKGDQHLVDWAIINLRVIRGYFDHTKQIFENWHFKLDGRVEAIREFGFPEN